MNSEEVCLYNPECFDENNTSPGYTELRRVSSNPDTFMEIRKNRKGESGKITIDNLVMASIGIFEMVGLGSVINIFCNKYFPQIYQYIFSK